MVNVRLKKFIKKIPIVGGKINQLYTKYKVIKNKIVHGNAGFIKCGFPKSGNTWLSFLIANMFARSAGKNVEINFLNHRNWVQTSRGRPKRPPAGDFPSIQSNHYKYEDQDYLGPDTKTVYLVRHPADVMESFYCYRRDVVRGEMNFDSKMEFIKSNNYGIPAWNEHVNSWYKKWDLLIKFEKMKECPVKVLKDICKLIEKNISNKTVNYAVQKSSFSHMKKMEDKYGHIDKSENKKNFQFMREGKSNKGGNFFNKEHIEYIRYHSRKNLSRLGYD